MISVRVSEKTHREVARLARAGGRTESSVVRQAIEAFVVREPPPTPYEALRDVIGIVEGAPADLSERTGEKYRTALLARRKGRR
jgi:hypothetical protein